MPCKFQDSDRIHNYSVAITIDVRDLPNEPPEFIRLPTSITVPEDSAVVRDDSLL